MAERNQITRIGGFQNYFILEDRKKAGQLLAAKLKRLRLRKPVVIAIPRGGVVLGSEVASALGCELDIVTPRKMHAPGEPELAIGAVMPDGSAFLNEYVIAARMVPESYIRSEKEAQMLEASRRFGSYRQERQYPNIESMNLILVDDGIATGATMMAAIEWAKKQNAASITIAAPVIPKEIVDEMEAAVDRIVCLAAPEYFASIGQFYSNFEQVDDSQVIEILEAFWTKR